MLKKINGFLTVLMGTWVGLLVGYLLFEVYPRGKYPDMFDIPDRPWYEEIVVHGLLILALILITVLLKILFRFLIRKRSERKTAKAEKRAAKEEAARQKEQDERPEPAEQSETDTQP